jgi:Concanavalin A-like lectin/glucanases superfamily
MAQTFSGTLHLSSTTLPATGFPVSLMMWVNTTGGQGRRFFELSAGASETTGVIGLLLDITGGASNKVSSYRLSGSTSNQALSSTAITTSAWQHAALVVSSSSSSAAYLNGGNKGTSSTAVSPATLTNLTISGRPSDFTTGIAGQAAHAAAWSRALSDTEVAYLGGGGNPRAVKGTVSYWKMSTAAGVAETPVSDQIGSNDLTPSATIGAGTSDPNFQTHMTGGPVGSLSYTAGTAITAINLNAGHVFDDVSSAFTSALSQLGTATSLTTTTGALTAAREVPLTSATGISAGDYIKLTSGGTPTRVLAMNGTTALVANDQTASSGAAVYRYGVSPLTIPGLGISSGSFSGTPTSAATNSLCFFRATCSGNAALMADSDLFTITVTGTGGGGGSGLMLPAGVFSGGMVGG